MIELEMCKRLKEAGFRQDTIFSHYGGNTPHIVPAPSYGLVDNIGFTNMIGSFFGTKVICACPTADEIWGELTEEQVSKLIYRWFNEEEPGDSIETALAEYWLEVNG